MAAIPVGAGSVEALGVCSWARQEFGRLREEGATVAVAMSGGVDSAVSAAVLAAAGVRTIGITMRLWGTDEMEQGEGGCCSIDAVEDARRVCARLDIPHYVLNLREHFRTTVVSDFLEQYQRGLTPNPCVRCNERVKFEELYRRARAAGATHLATGHYARLRADTSGRLGLFRAVDRRKDQSYTLYRTPPEVLSKSVLPVGELEKSQVRALAAALGLGVAAKPDSQELCFVGGGDHREVLRRDLQGRYSPGPIVDLAGEEVGTHQGLPFYTVGQRHGLELKVRRPDAEPQYVVGVDARSNLVRVGPWRALLAPGCRLERLVRLVPGPVPPDRRFHAQLRAHGAPVAATWTPRSGAQATVDFADPQPGVSPGQSVVIYDDDQVVAGGEVMADQGRRNA